jgi:plastocyanin
MSGPAFVPRRVRRAQARAEAKEAGPGPAHERATPTNRLRGGLFLVVVVAVLAVGAYLAFGDFLRRPVATTADAISIQSSMAGFDPGVITVTAGTTATFDWWTDDSAAHLAGGVHTMIAPELGLLEELPAESRRTVSWAVPDKPGSYDVYCDTCCGGRASPTMHGTIVIEEAMA